MTIVQQSNDPTEYVPSIFFNHCGFMAWSGRHVSELTGMEVVSILEFCQREGSRQGWNDSLYDRVGEREAGPFHQDLLGGFPAQEWARSYRTGVQQQQAVPNC